MRLVPDGLRSLLISLVLAAAPICAQPSGGPYGPIDQRYEIPKAAHVYYVAPDGKPDATGAALDQPTTLEAAIERVVTGDAIVMRGGIYRTGGLTLNQGITIQPYADERPVIKGTQLPEKWEPLRNNIWRTQWKQLFPGRAPYWFRLEREGMRTPLHRFNNDKVFVDGEMLTSVGWLGELDAHSFFIDYQGGYIYIGVNPANRLVEITAFRSGLARVTGDAHGKKSDGKGPTIRGITFTQYASRAFSVDGKDPAGLQDPSTFGKDVTGTVLENVTLSYSGLGAYIRGDGLVIRNSLITDTITEGLYISASSDVLLERNIIRRNNVTQLTGMFPAGVKIFNQTRRVVCRDNLVTDQRYSNGIWYDVGNRDGVFINNYVEGAQAGFFFEISRGITVAGNVFVRCETGIRILNSADARVYNNTFVNTPATFSRNTRSAVGDTFGWHPTTGPDVDQREGHFFVNNLLVSDAYGGPLLLVDQAPALCGKLTRTPMKALAGNVYVRQSVPGADAATALISWSPSEADNCTSRPVSLADFRKLAPAFEAAGQQADASPRSVFKGADLGNYETVRKFTQPSSTETLPEDIRKLLGWSPAQARTQGAYPSR